MRLKYALITLAFFPVSFLYGQSSSILPLVGIVAELKEHHLIKSGAIYSLKSKSGKIYYYYSIVVASKHIDALYSLDSVRGEDVISKVNIKRLKHTDDQFSFDGDSLTVLKRIDCNTINPPSTVIDEP